MAHIAAVLGSQDQLDLIPGIREALLLIMSIRFGSSSEDKTDKCNLGNSAPIPDDNDKGGKALIRGYFTLRSFQLTSRLGCVSAQLVLDGNQLTETVNMHRRMQTHLSSEDVRFARLLADSVKKFLHTKNDAQDKIASVLFLETAGTTVGEQNLLGAKPKQRIPLPRSYTTGGVFGCGCKFNASEKQVVRAIKTADRQRREQIRAERDKEHAEQMVRISFHWKY